jgi:hypothetical protein
MPIEFLKRMVASTLGNMSPSQECQDCARNLLVNTKVSNLPNTTKSRPLTILKDNCTVEQALSVGASRFPVGTVDLHIGSSAAQTSLGLL